MFNKSIDKSKVLSDLKTKGYCAIESLITPEVIEEIENEVTKSRYALKDAIRKEAKNQSGQLVIYPEGTRTIPGQEVEYKRGVLILFSSLNRPLYLVSTNAGVAWSKTGKFKENSNASINFLEKINYSKQVAYNLNYIRNKIEKDSQKLYKEELLKVR